MKELINKALNDTTIKKKLRRTREPSKEKLLAILDKSVAGSMLNLDEIYTILAVDNPRHYEMILDAANKKETSTNLENLSASAFSKTYAWEIEFIAIMTAIREYLANSDEELTIELPFSDDNEPADFSDTLFNRISAIFKLSLPNETIILK